MIQSIFITGGASLILPFTFIILKTANNSNNFLSRIDFARI